MRHNDILAIVNPGEGDVQLAAHAKVRIFGEMLLESLQEDVLHAEGGAEGAQRPAPRLAHDVQHVRGDLAQGQVAQQRAGRDGPGRGARDLVEQQVRGVLLEADGDADMVDAEEATAGERQIHCRLSGRHRQHSIPGRNNMTDTTTHPRDREKKLKTKIFQMLTTQSVSRVSVLRGPRLTPY